MTATEYPWTDLLNSIGPARTFLAAAVLPVAWLWRQRENSWRYNARKSRDFRKLLPRDDWQHAPALQYQYAVHDAFGHYLSKAELALIVTRERSLKLIRDRLKAGSWIQFNDDASGWSPSSSFRSKEGVRRRATVFQSLGWLMALLTILAVAWLIVVPNFSAVLAFAYGFMLTIAGFGIGSELDAADRLVRLEKVYPAAQTIPEHLKAERPLETSKVKKSSKGKKSGNGRKSLALPKQLPEAPKNEAEVGAIQ